MHGLFACTNCSKEHSRPIQVLNQLLKWHSLVWIQIEQQRIRELLKQNKLASSIGTSHLTSSTPSPPPPWYKIMDNIQYFNFHTNYWEMLNVEYMHCWYITLATQVWKKSVKPLFLSLAMSWRERLITSWYSRFNWGNPVMKLSSKLISKHSRS